MNHPVTPPTYLFLFREPAAPSGLTPEEMPAVYQRWLDWVASMQAKGQYVAGEPLEPGPAAVLRGEEAVSVTDGPFAEAKEIVGGYMMIRAANLAEAIAIARGCPGLKDGGSVEVRQVMPMAP